MKKIIKNILITASFTAAATCFWAEESKIELPDLTTVVTSEQTDIEEIAVPDFADVVNAPENSGHLVLEMPDVEVLEKSDVVVTVKSANNKQVYVEGQAGGGYPASFLGSFTVSRITGNDPFKVEFYHSSENGYAQKDLSSGYFDRDTNISLDKTFSWNAFKLDLNGFYESSGVGLQSAEPDILAINQNKLNGSAAFNWEIGNGFNLGTKLGLDYYFRFADLDIGASCDSFIKHASVFAINPSIYGNWSNDSFAAELSGSVWMDGDLQSAFDSGHQYSNRGLINLTGNWNYNKLNVYGNVGFVLGDNLNSNKIIVPFGLGVSTSFPVYYSDRNVVLLAEAGLKPDRNTNGELENLYKYSALNVLPSETSNWFANLNISVPLKTEFTGDLGLTFKNTAFENGVWEPVYKASGYQSGIYTYQQNEKTVFATDIGVTYRHGIFAGTLKWHANWKDVPVLEDRHDFYVDLSFQDPDVKWGVNLNSEITLDGADKIPVVNLESFAGITPQVKLVLQAEDVLKFFDSQPRIYGGKYITDSGNLKLLVKFLY